MSAHNQKIFSGDVESERELLQFNGPLNLIVEIKFNNVLIELNLFNN